MKFLNVPLNTNHGVSLVDVKNMAAMHETQFPSLGHEDTLEKRMTTHSSIFAWRISWTEEPGKLESMGSQRIGYNWATNTFIETIGIGFSG